MPHFVVLGVTVLAIVGSIMIVNWAKLIYPKCESKIMVLAVLSIFNTIGLVSVVFLIYSRLNPKDMYLTTRNTFLKIKLISMYIFGLGYFFHCGLYLWKHSNPNDCSIAEENDAIEVLGICYNLLSLLYIFLLFIYFALFYVRKRNNTVLENFASLGVLLANLFIWLDTLFSESDFLFTRHWIQSNSSQLINLTESSQSIDQAMGAIEKTDPFLSPAMIEFSLMAIDMLFATTDDASKSSLPDDSKEDRHDRDAVLSKLSINLKNLNPESNKSKPIAPLVKKTVQIFFSLAAFTFFAFTFTVVLTNDSYNNLIEIPDDFYFYISLKLSIKLVMIILTFFCLFIEWQRLTFRFNVWAFVLIITCFGNIVYHMLYCFALHYESSKGSKNHTDKDTNIKKEFLNVDWTENIISIILASSQTLFILGFHSPKNNENFLYFNSTKKCEKYFYEKFVCFACSVLGVLNLGFWASDSIGEGQFPVFTIAMYRAYEPGVWSFIIKIILPLTIFYRFHTGLDFLEFFWKLKSNVRIIKRRKSI